MAVFQKWKQLTSFTSSALCPLILVPWSARKSFSSANYSLNLTRIQKLYLCFTVVYVLPVLSLRISYWLDILSVLRNIRGALRNRVAAQPSFSGLQVSTVSSQVPPAFLGTQWWQFRASPGNNKSKKTFQPLSFFFWPRWFSFSSVKMWPFLFVPGIYPVPNSVCKLLKFDLVYLDVKGRG